MNDAALWLAYMEKWHDFFLLTGTAAVTLVGLLFVAISLHVEALVAAGREHLLELARASLMAFVLVLVLSLNMLVPALPRRVIAVQLIVLGGLFVIMTLRTLIVVKGRGHQHFTLGRFRRRLILPLLGYVWILLVGWDLRGHTNPQDLNAIIGGVVLILGNALGTSWELLVRVARVRHSDAEEAARGVSPEGPRSA